MANLYGRVTCHHIIDNNGTWKNRIRLSLKGKIALSTTRLFIDPVSENVDYMYTIFGGRNFIKVPVLMR